MINSATRAVSGLASARDVRRIVELKKPSVSDVTHLSAECGTSQKFPPHRQHSGPRRALVRCNRNRRRAIR